MTTAVPPLLLRCAALLLAGALLAGCAGAQQRPPGDPLEPVNRRVHAFNDAFDRGIAQPVARGYRAVTPRPVDRGVSNFFNNLDDVSVLVNSALQLKGRKAAATTLRLALNTTFGIYGLIDIASALGIPKEDEDFGQTLGRWGVDSGPYLVLPILGPSTLRDGPARVADAQYAPLRQVSDSRTRYGAIVLRGVDFRASLLGATDVLETAAIDPYSYMRDAWLRRRAVRVYDGHPPPGALPGAPRDEDDGFDPFSDEDDDLFDDEPAGDAGADANR